ncbi:MAG: FAD-binding oxidoreductase [Myxococcota bacterium]
MRLSGWGGNPALACDVYRPEALAEVEDLIGSAPSPSLISRGMGRSYGDASLNENAGVVLHERLNRFISFDSESHILHCEAGVTLSEIIDHLLPLGYFLPITPGTKQISLGGAIAADVHGKNHHKDGTISTQVLDFRLLTAGGEILPCSRTENADLFWATLGGMGLTGVVLDTRLRLRPVETAYLHAGTKRCRDLDATLAEITEHDRDYAYAVAWVDCLARGRSLGRSVLLRANHATRADLPPTLSGSPYSIRQATRPSVPFPLPGFVLNRISMRLVNSAYYFAHSSGGGLVDYQRYFYPLDAIGHWNRIYGRRGVLQYQLVLPLESSQRGLQEIMELVTASGWASFLAVIKSTGPANPGPLSFPLEGTSLALDFPNRGAPLHSLLAKMDRVVLRHGGRTYLAKDSTLAPDTFREMYPRLDEFLAVKQKFDPEVRFSSSLSRRLGIGE